MSKQLNVSIFNTAEADRYVVDVSTNSRHAQFKLAIAKLINGEEQVYILVPVTEGITQDAANQLLDTIRPTLDEAFAA